MKIFKSILSILILLLSQTVLFGQANKNAFLDTLTVTATRLPVSAIQSGRNITVIYPKDWQDGAVNSIDELLRYLPGVEVQTRGAFGAQADITMRGSTFTQVLVLIDGMRLNDPLTGHFNHAIPISPAEIEQIEVLRGSAASLYGPDAVGGVINFITKTFSSSPQKEGMQSAATFLFGENRLQRQDAGVFIKKDKLKFGLGFLNNTSNGQEIEEQLLISDGDTTSLEAFNTFFDVKTFSGSVAYELNPNWSLHARSAYDFREFNARYYYTASTFDKSVEETTTFWNQFQLVNKTKKRKTELQFSHKRNTDDFVFNPLFTGNFHTTHFANGQINHVQDINQSHQIGLGIQTDFRKIESNDRGNHKDIHTGIYATHLWKVFPGVNLNSSLRGDYDQNYDFELSPQITLAYYKPTWSFRMSGGRSIRAADYTERYVSNNLVSLSGGRNLGNPDLDAENSWTYEVGSDYSPLKGFRIGGTFFLRKSKRLIDYISTAYADIPNNGNLLEGEAYFYASNISDVRSIGIEAIMSYEKKYSDKFATDFDLGYTFANTSNDEDLISTYLSSHAKHLITTNFRIHLPYVSLALSGLYKERPARVATGINSELKSSYSVWHLSLSGELYDGVSLVFQIHNLFDVEYADILGAPMPNRWLMGGLKWNITR